MIREPVKDGSRKMAKHVFATARTDIVPTQLADEITTAGLVNNGISYQPGVHVRVDTDAASLTPSEQTLVENAITNHNPTSQSLLALLAAAETEISNAATVAQLKTPLETIRYTVELLAKANGFR